MSSSETLDLYLITFNCGRELINREVFASHLFDGLSTPSTATSGSSTLPEVIVLNLQEISPIAYAFLGGSFVTPYIDRFRNAVDLATKQQSTAVSNGASNDQEDLHYVNIRLEIAGLTAIMVFIRSDLLGCVSDIMTAGIGVGVQEMGNKGAVGVRLSWSLDGPDGESEKMNMTFVSAHLAAMEDQLERRNQDYKDIVRGLIFTPDHAKPSITTSHTSTTTDEGEEDVPLLQEDTTTTDKPSPSSQIDLYNRTHHLFFAGDLNYRTSSTTPSKSDPTTFPSPSQLQATSTTSFPLLKRDQLTLAQSSNQTLHGLTEHSITFPPTYKYKFPDTDTTNTTSNPITTEVLTESDFKSRQSYPFATHRWPSWCDRILFSPTPSLKPLRYTCLPLFRTSDHRPVTLYVRIPLQVVDNPTFANQRPVPIDEGWRKKRETARRKEIVVGVLAYLGLTWEGRALGVGGLILVVGIVWMVGGMGW